MCFEDLVGVLNIFNELGFGFLVCVPTDYSRVEVFKASPAKVGKDREA